MIAFSIIDVFSAGLECNAETLQAAGRGEVNAYHAIDALDRFVRFDPLDDHCHDFRIGRHADQRGLAVGSEFDCGHGPSIVAMPIEAAPS